MFDPRKNHIERNESDAVICKIKLTDMKPTHQ